MCSAIDNHTNCEISHSNPPFHAKNMSAVEIYHELRTVYSQNVMSERTVRQWWRMFRDGQTNVYDED
jgi:hypothetical protein